MSNGKKNGKDLVKQEPAALTTPDFMKKYAGQGTEAISAHDVEVPRVKLLQALSPEVQNGEHRPNTFYHTLAEENLGAEVEVVPVYVDQSFILWRPRKSGGGMLARAADGIHWDPPNATFEVQLDSGKRVTWRTAKTVQQSGLAAWGSEDPETSSSPPAATRMVNVVVMMTKRLDLGPAVVTFQRSAIKVARKFVGKLKISTAPSYGQKFVMSGVRDRNTANQEFFNFSMKMAGFVEDEALFDNLRLIYERFRKMGLSIKDLEQLQQDDIPAGAGEDMNPEGKAF
jgi:hypothetical protein